MTETLTLKSLTPEEKAAFERDGYYIARGLFSAEEIAEARDAFQRQGDKGPQQGLQVVPSGADEDDPLARYPRMMHPHRHDELEIGPIARRMMLDSRLESILHDLLEDEPVAAQSMFYFKPAGARGQDLHQDNFYLQVAPESCMAAWIAVDDADRDNGGLVIVPGSQHLDVMCPEKTTDRSKFFNFDHVPVPEGMEEVPADMKAGDVLFFNGSVIHGSYPNTSKDRYRRSLICHYAPYGSEKTSQFYKPLLRMDGTEVDHVEFVTEGGPCGSEYEITAPH